MKSEKRQYKRKNITIDVEYDISLKQKYMDSKTINISAGGMCLVSTEPFEVDSTVNLKFYVPEFENPIYTLGRVLWNEEFNDGITKKVIHYYNGVEFVNLSHEDRELLDKYVESTTFYTDY